MSQLNYNTEPGVALAGMPGDLHYTGVKTYNNPVDEIEFGRGVAQVSGDTDGCELPDGSGADFLGVARRSLGDVNTDEEELYEANSSVAVINDGTVWVQVEEAVAVSDPVFVRHSGAAQVQTITFDIDFVISNDIDLDVDGVAMTTVTYAASHTATITALASQIQTQFSQIATAVADAVARTVVMTASTVGAAGDFLVENIAVTSGASQATGTVAETFASVESADKGKFRNDAYNSTCLQVTGARWLEYDSTNSLAKLSVKIA